METWNIFYGNDVVIGLLGALGFISMLVVIFSASAKVDKHERVLREANRALTNDEAQEEIGEALKYESSK